MRGTVTASLLFILAAGCEVPDPTLAAPTTYDAQIAAYQEPDLRVYRVGLNGDFETLARQVSGFAGTFYEADRLIVVGTNRNSLSDDLDRIRQRFPAPEVEVRTVPFSFLQLAAAAQSIKDGGYPEGMNTLDIAEQDNVVRVGYDPLDFAAFSRIEERLAERGVPRTMVEIVPSPPSIWASSLTGRYRPTVGGLSVRGLGTNGHCTMWNVSGPAVNWQRGFITASHCTDNIADTTHQVFYQPGPWPGNRIGVEYIETPFDGASCRRCRESDAMVGLYDDSVRATRGYIARPNEKARWQGTLEWSGTLKVTAQYSAPSIGMILSKVGQTTGWTWGDVEDTCVEVFIEEEWLLCADWVNGGAYPGDSGAPVFRELGGDAVGMYGLLVAVKNFDNCDPGICHNYWMSSIDAIEDDLGGGLWSTYVSASIEGPPELSRGEPGTWYAATDGGYSPHTFRWFKDGILVGSDSSYTTSSFFQFGLRLEVEDDAGWFSSDSRTIFVEGPGGPG